MKEDIEMIQLLNGGAYLVDGKQVIPAGGEAAAELKAAAGVSPAPEEAKKNTIAYGILKAHNTSGNMEDLQIKFDKLTSHDITFVGIIQTARASGLEKFPVPYVLTLSLIHISEKLPVQLNGVHIEIL